MIQPISKTMALLFVGAALVACGSQGKKSPGSNPPAAQTDAENEEAEVPAQQPAPAQQPVPTEKPPETTTPPPTDTASGGGNTPAGGNCSMEQILQILMSQGDLSQCLGGGGLPGGGLPGGGGGLPGGGGPT